MESKWEIYAEKLSDMKETFSRAEEIHKIIEILEEVCKELAGAEEC